MKLLIPDVIWEGHVIDELFRSLRESPGDVVRVDAVVNYLVDVFKGLEMRRGICGEVERGEWNRRLRVIYEKYRDNGFEWLFRRVESSMRERQGKIRGSWVKRLFYLT